MRENHEILFIVLAFISEIIGTLSGVSSSTLFVPLAKLLESVQITLVLTAALHVLGNTVRTLLYWKSIDWPLVFKFGGLSVLFTGVGAFFSDAFSERIFSVLLGLFLVLFSGYKLFVNTNFSTAARWVPYAGGALSGLLTGLLGSGGAIRSLALASFGLSPIGFVATSTLIDFGGDVARLGIYLKKGYLNSEHYFYIPILAAVVLAANLLAKVWLIKIPKETFSKIVYSVVMMMGIFSIASGVLWQSKN